MINTLRFSSSMIYVRVILVLNFNVCHNCKKYLKIPRDPNESSPSLTEFLNYNMSFFSPTHLQYKDIC